MRFSARETLTLALAALPLTSASLEKRASKYDDYKVYQIDAVGVNYTEIARAAATAARQTPSLPAMSWFESYRRFEDHLAWLDDVRAAFPKNSQTFVAGKSVEGRQIKGIHLPFGYMAYKLVDGYLKGDSISKSAIDKFDFYIMPVVNPDGFVYSHRNNQLWRRNRQSWPGLTCIGADINRNWPHKWNVAGGASDNPCDESFRGLAAGDTTENAALVSHTTSVARAQGINLFADFHSYSHLILLPYGYTCDAKPKTVDRQMKLARGVAAAIKAVNQLKFKYGPACKTAYQMSGLSMDWGYDVAGAELAWGYEMRPSKGTIGGFAIPPDNIVPSGEEQWAGFKNLLANW